MANLRQIRARIRSVESTQRITKAMKMVSMAKRLRAQSGAEGLKLFAAKCRELLSRLPSGLGEEPLLMPRKHVSHVCYVLFVGDRGLCGTYNHGVLRYAKELLEAEEREHSLVVVGRWGRDVIEADGLPVREWFTDFGDVPSGEDAAHLTEYLRRMYLDGEADEIHLVYQHDCSALRQTPISEKLLPVSFAGESRGGEPAGYILEPSAGAVLRNAVEMYFRSAVFSVLREAKVGEQAARMAAMTAAADANAEMIDRLSLELNRARQAAITTELSEIVGGANALRQMREDPLN